MWMTTKKSASEVKKAKQMAEEARKAKNRRKPSAAAKKGGKKQTKINVGNKKKRKKYDSSSSEESFNDYSEEEEEDQFIVGSDDEEEDNGGIGDDDSDEDLGGWDSAMEEDSDESDFGARKKKKGKQNNNTAASRSARAAKRRTQRPSWNNKAAEEDDEIEETPAKGRVVKKRAKKKKAQSPIDSDEDMSDVNADTSMDDIYADDVNNTKKKGANKKEVVDVDSDSSATAIDEEEDMSTKKKKSPYFAAKKKDVIDIDDDDGGGEEKKEDDEVLNHAYKKKGSKKQRSILDDSDSDEEFLGSGNNNVNFDDLDDTPGKPRKTSSFSPDDYADEEEAIAITEAMKASEGDAGQHKRLKKKGKKKSSKGASSLEQIKSASPAKNKVMYKDDIEGELADSDDDHQEDDEIEVYEVDEGEQTATQVLAEANALSAKIIKAVSGWCNSSGNDGEKGSGNNVKGLLLGDGTLNLGNGKADGKKQGEGDEMWISDETMKEILPNVKLAEYQLLGVNWMALLNRTKFGKAKSGKKGNNVNGILADEMGLGKTVQTIAFLAWLNHQRKTSVIDLDKDGTDDTAATRRPHLIAVPASVLSNWMNEFKKFAPDMVVKKYHGSQAEREEIRNDLEMNHFVYSKSEGKAVIGGAPLDVILTTFSYFSSDSNKNDRQFLRKFDFDYLIVDEGHTLKNPKGLRYKNLYKFKTSHRLLLTGTPVQNSPKELMSLLTFLMPLFDRKTKSSKRITDSDDENDGGERMLEYFVHLEGGDGDDAQAYRKLKQLFAPFVLRRKKDDVLGQLLPPKIRQVDLVPMDEKARTAYDSILADHVKARSEIASGAKANATAQQHLFTQLRKAANHPLLLRKRFTSEEERKDLAMRAMNHGYFGSDASLTVGLCLEEMDKYSDYEIHCAAMAMIEENPSGRKQYLEKYTLMEEDLFCSPKFVRLRSLLPELIGNGHRLLIFSQWTKIMDLMEILMNSSLNLKFLRLDGSTAVSERQDLIDTFNNDDSIPVFLLSTRAGGMGLNLTAADVCILHDLDFNPFNDRQAEDRCHRIGQKKPVTVIKLVSEGTVDEDIYRMQERKESMNDAIMEDGGGKKKKKSKDNEEMANMTNAALERFMKKSPLKLSEAAKSSSNDGRIEAKSSSNDAVVSVKNTRPELTTAKLDDDSSTEDEQDGQKSSAASALKQNNSTADDVIKLDDESSTDDEQEIKKPATTLHSPLSTGVNKKIDVSSTEDGQILRPTVAAAPKYASKADEEAASELRKSNVPDNNESDGEATVKQDNKQEKKGPLLARLAAAESSDSDSDDDMLEAFRAKKAKESAGKSKSLSY